MAKFHINPSTGNPGRCLALKKCRFGGDDEHHATKELAAAAYEKMNAHEEIPVLRKATVAPEEPKPKLEDFAVGLHEPKGEPLAEDQIAEVDAKFQNLKDSSSRAMEDFKTPSVIENHTASTTLRFENGRGLVNLKGSGADQIDGDYPIGDLTQDSDTVTKLLQQDPNLQYINGDCATLAWDLYEAYPDKVQNISEIWIKGDYDSMHTIAQLNDGSYIDGLGHWSPSGVLDAWKGMMNGKEVEMRVFDTPMNRATPFMFESTKIIGKYLDSLK